MTFENPETLAFFAAAAVALGVTALARRYSKARATYGFIWERLAARRRAPRWISIARKVLALLLTAAITSGLILAAAGPSLDPPSRNPVANEYLIILDTSPSTVRRQPSGLRTLTAIINRAVDRVSALKPNDRAWIACLQHGAPTLRGPYQAGEGPRAATDLAGIESDFVPSSTAELAKAARVLASALASESAASDRQGADASANSVTRVRTAILVSDDDRRFPEFASGPAWPRDHHGFPSVVAEYVGSPGPDAAFTSVEAIGDGRVRVVARGGKRIRAAWYSGADATNAVTPDADGGLLVDLLLPAGESGIRLSLDADDDPLPENNTLELSGQPADPPSIGAVAADDLGKSLIRTRLQYVAPPDVPTHDRLPNNPLNDTMVVAHGTGDIGIGPGVRLLVAFGAIPPGIAATDPERTGGIASGLLEFPPWLMGSEAALPLDSVRIEKLRPLAPTERGWQVLCSDSALGPLVLAKRFDGLDAVYFVSDGFGSDLLRHPTVGLFLRRVLARGALPPVRELTTLPLVRTGDVIGLGPGAWRVTVKSPFLWNQREFDVLPGTSGMAGLADTWYPGSYRAEPLGEPGQGRDTHTVNVQWLADSSEIPFLGGHGNLPPLPVPEPGTADSGSDLGSGPGSDSAPGSPLPLAHMLLLAVIGLLLVEWLLYWIRISD